MNEWTVESYRLLSEYSDNIIAIITDETIEYGGFSWFAYTSIQERDLSAEIMKAMDKADGRGIAQSLFAAKHHAGQYLVSFEETWRALTGEEKPKRHLNIVPLSGENNE